MQIGLDVDLRSVGALTERVERQLPFAASVALNRTAEAFQARQQLHLRRAFTIRRDWVLRGVKIERADRATKTKLNVKVKIDPTRGFLTKFEAGGRKVPQDGRSVAIPERGVFPRSGVVPRRQRPRAYQFQRHVTTGGHVQEKGTHRTFILETGRGRGVFQRRGRRRGSTVRLLFWLAPSARIQPSLNYVATAHRTVHEEWAPQFQRAFDEAMRTAR